VLYSKFDTKANQLLVELLPAAAPVAIAAGPAIASWATALLGGLIAVGGTIAAIKSGKLTPAATPASTPQTQPIPQEQPLTLPNIERGKPGYAVPTNLQPQTQAQQASQAQQQNVALPTQSTSTAPAGTNITPPAIQAPVSQNPITPPVAVPPTPGETQWTRKPFQKDSNIEAYPTDPQLGNINMPGVKTAYRDTFNMPAMQAFDVGLNQPPVQQNTPQGDISNAPKSLRAKYQNRAQTPDEYEGSKAFGGLGNLFK
jgi:hypothetical protein